MKSIVVEKNHENCVLLLSDGTFRTVKNTDELQIGSVIYMNNTERSKAFYLKKVVSMAAAVLIVAFIGLGAYSWTFPAQYISIDINPSVELVINCYNRIIRMAPLNDDGERLLESVDLQLKQYQKGVNEVIETAKHLGYLADEGDVLISVSSSNRELRQKTQEEIEKKVKQKAEVLIFGSDEHDRSVQEGLSPGKSQIIDKVLESGTNLTEEELAAAPVKDLMLRVKENKKMNLELQKEAKQQEKMQKEMEKAGRKENNESNGNKQGDQDNQGKGNENSAGRKGNAEPGNQGQPPGKPQGEGSKNNPSSDAGNEWKDQQSHHKEREEEKDNGNQSTDKKDNRNDKIKQNSDADQEKPPDKSAKDKEKNDKSSDNGNDTHGNSNNGTDANKNNKKDTGKDSQNNSRNSGGNGKSGGGG